MDAVAAAARAANEEPVVYVAADAELRSARRVVVDQPVYAWVERALGDDDAAAQLEAVMRLGAATDPAAEVRRRGAELSPRVVLVVCFKENTTRAVQVAARIRRKRPS